MKKSWIIIVGIVLIIIAALAYVLLSGNKVSSPQDATQASDTPAQVGAPEQQPENHQAPPTPPGAYTTYSEQAFAKAEGRRILFFHASWCPQCRALEQSIQAGAIPSGVTIFKVDYDTATALRQKYGVTIQTTLVEVGVASQEVGKYVAYDTPTLEAVIKGLKLQ